MNIEFIKWGGVTGSSIAHNGHEKQMGKSERKVRVHSRILRFIHVPLTEHMYVLFCWTQNAVQSKNLALPFTSSTIPALSHRYILESAGCPTAKKCCQHY
jgi:hypothetical protein